MIFSSESERPNQVKYQVRNGTTMKSEATMMSQTLLGRRGFVATRDWAVLPLVLTKSFDMVEEQSHPQITQITRIQKANAFHIL